MKRFISCLIYCIVFLMLPNNIRAVEKPNIIVIFSDDHGYADLSVQGVFDDVKTPNIDFLANHGRRCSAGYVTAPQCVPSRAGLLTGRSQNRFGVESNGEDLTGFNEQLTIAERLKQRGYATGMVGKWHLGAPGDIVTHGFDDVFYTDGRWSNFDTDGNDVKAGTTFPGRYHLEQNNEAALAFIQRHHDEPFFLYLAHRAPHVPLSAPKKYLDRFTEKMPKRRRLALAMLSCIDDGVGAIRQSLEQHGIEENTLIFFIGDNGAPLKIHKLDAPGGGPGWDGSLNDPFNGEKGMLTEGGIRVPFVVYWKGMLGHEDSIDDSEYHAPVSSLDVAATAASLAGIELDDSFDGVNLIPYLSGQRAGVPHNTLYWRWMTQAAVQSDGWKYLRSGPREYLFNLEQDPGEKNNLINEHPQVSTRLSSELEAWATELSPAGLKKEDAGKAVADFYDFYLEGKPAPKLPEFTAPSTAPIQGIIPRSASLKHNPPVLSVTPQDKNKVPFLVLNGLKLPSTFEVRMMLKNQNGGQAKVAWRRDGERDFDNASIVTTNVPKTNKFQEVKLQVATSTRVVHLRIVLPKGDSSIQHIEAYDSSGNLLIRKQFR